MYSNQKITSSLTPVLVEYKKVGRWNGELPHVVGGNTPLINIK